MSRIRLILNGVDTDLFAPVGSGNLHKELGLPADTPIVGAVGNIRPAKSYDVLIEAARHVLVDSPHVHFVIAGAGGEADLALLRAMAERSQIERNVHFLGFRHSSSDLYRSFTVMVSSASTEGLPLSFLEALSCEVPIAATANEGAARLIATTKAGLLSPVGDAQALAESIRALIKDAAKAASLARNGRIAVIERFSIERTLAQYRDLFTEIQLT
jgi:glycosyltransferase involved in cell wall biosynthesis